MVGTDLSIKGFANIAGSQVVSAKGQRFVAEKLGTMALEAPTAAALGIAGGDVNVPVVAHIRVNTTRHSSEWATDFIKRGRPFIFEIIVNGTDSADKIAEKLDAAFTEYQFKFNLSASGLPWTWSTTTDTLSLTLKGGELSFQSYVAFTVANSTYGTKAATTVVAGAEATIDGAYLEENVRMSTSGTSDSYGISPDEKPIISGSYTQITFSAKVENGVGIAGIRTAAPHKGAEGVNDQISPGRMHTFTLYFLEESDLLSGGTVEALVEFLITAGAPVAGFLLADGSSATDAAEFVA